MDKTLMNPAEVAKVLGVHPNTARKLIKDGIIKSVSIGTHKRVSRPQLEAYINTGVK